MSQPGPLTDIQIATIDTAPTVLWLLGVTEPDVWNGTPVLKVFRQLNTE